MDDVASTAKKVLIIARWDDRGDYDTALSMAEKLNGAASEGLVYEACFLEQVVFCYDGTELHAYNSQNDQDLARYDAIFLLGWFKKRRHEDVALSVSMYAAAASVPVFNSEALHNRSRSKLSQLVSAVQQGVATTPFAIAIDKSALIRYSEALSNLEYPMIVKSASASRGSFNYLVQDGKEYHQTMEEAPTKIFVAQTFIPNDGDYRLIVCRDQVRLAIHRRADNGSHLNNTSQGAKATLVSVAELPEAMLSDAVKMAKALGREITGVDMIVDVRDGKHYFLEINNMPQLSTGSFVEEKATVLNDFFREVTGADQR